MHFFGVNFILQKFCQCKKMTNIRYGLRWSAPFSGSKSNWERRKTPGAFSVQRKTAGEWKKTSSASKRTWSSDDQCDPPHQMIIGPIIILRWSIRWLCRVIKTEGEASGAKKWASDVQFWPKIERFIADSTYFFFVDPCTVILVSKTTNKLW